MYYWLFLREEVVADEERSQVAREVLVAGDCVSGARERQSEDVRARIRVPTDIICIYIDIYIYI